MTYTLSDSEIGVVAMLSPEGRFDYFVEKLRAGGEVWSLQCDDGWVVMTSDEGEECLPVWPHEAFAAEWASGEWSDCQPASIPLNVWIERWTPGLEGDGTLLAVFPDEQSEGTILAPSELLQSLDS